MGNHKFRFSDMIPNAWFYKLKGMSRTRNKYPKASPSHSIPINKKPSYPSTTPQNFRYFTKDTHFPDSPRISSKRKARRRRRTIYRPSPRATLSISPFESESEADGHHFAPESCDHHQVVGSSDSNSCYNCKLTSSATDIIIDMMNNESCRCRRKLTKPAAESSNYKNKEKLRRVREAKARRSLSVKINVKEESIGTHETRKCAGIKVRTNSPRIASNKIQAACARKSISSRNIRRFAESFAVVKLSVDPQRDFRDSMVEMIVENNMRASKDLEQLLACYLSLNSREDHHLIIKAFEQIWFDLCDQLI